MYVKATYYTHNEVVWRPNYFSESIVGAREVE